MKKYLCSTSAVLILLLMTSRIALSDGYKFDFYGHSYEIVFEKVTQTAAFEAARNAGGHLVFINSKEENDTVLSAIINGAKVPIDYASADDGGGTAYVWIGATDKFNEGVWVWYDPAKSLKDTFWLGEGAKGNNDGRPVGARFVNWGGKADNLINEPDNYENLQDGAAMALDAWPLGAKKRYGIAGEWNDLNSVDELYYVIEYESKQTKSTGQ